MKSITLFFANFALLGPTHAHYIFGRLILDSKWSSTWEYIREVSPLENVDPTLALQYPQTDPTSESLRCGRNATTAWSQPKTAVVNAGDTVGFGVGEYSIGSEPRMYHPGIASAWLSNFAGENLNEYAGDGDWVKIVQTKGREAQSVNFTKDENKALYDQLKSLWGTYQSDSWNFTIPAATPAGRYLLRFEHIFPNTVDAQFYVNCAHIEVTNRGTAGTPGPSVKIPGVYTRGQKDVYFSTYDYGIAGSLDGYTTPAPAVWNG